MTNIIIWGLIIVAIYSFILCAVDVAYNKNYELSDNLSSGMAVLASFLILVMVCTVVSDINGKSILELNGLVEGLNNVAATAIPYYDFIANVQDGEGLLKFYENNSLEFAEEFIQVVFLSMIMDSQFVRLEIKKQYSFLKKVSTGIMALAIGIILYSLFQKTMVSAILINILVALISMTPICFLLNKIILGNKFDALIFIIIARYSMKNILKAIAYMIFVYVLSKNLPEIKEAISIIGYLVPTLTILFILIGGIVVCIRSISS